ncbi:hypothetical protein Goari_014229 [Gossypium aridum]|uniref:Uncharacterized protein n=1 Tax=Gossypium aridum TaxID=34290 RepID=A0A7J8XH87_GOSAI|nr:hypothetical protein [Gossypium aridum]
MASSAVVHAVYNYTDYDKQVGESAGPECKAVLQEITELVDRSLETNKKELKKQFGAAELEIDGDFLYFLADAAVVVFQYGHPDALCTPLVEAKKGRSGFGGMLAAYAKYVKEYFVGTFCVSVETYNQKHLKNTAVNEGSSDWLWWFQVCTEVAYFQVAPSNDTVRSSKIDTELQMSILSVFSPLLCFGAHPTIQMYCSYCRYHLDLCKNVFGEGIYPEVDVTNIYYGGTNIADSKIIFTNGSQDPWRHASKQTSSPGMPSYIITCHNCGHGIDMRECPQSVSSIEGNAQSCNIPDAVNKVRQKMIEHINLWLSECKGSGWHSM